MAKRSVKAWIAVGLVGVAAACSAVDLSDYQATIEQIESWKVLSDEISYKGTNRTLKAYANAQNTAVKTIAKLNEKLTKAEAEYQKATSLNRDASGLLVENQPLWGKGRQAILARAEIQHNDVVKSVERGITSAKKKCAEAQKITLQDLRRKLVKEKVADEEDKSRRDELVQRVSELIENLTAN